MVKRMFFTVTALTLLTGCDFKKTEKGELPEIDVDVAAEAGELPEYDVDWDEVNVGTKMETVEIPKVVVVMEEEENLTERQIPAITAVEDQSLNKNNPLYGKLSKARKRPDS